MVKNGLNLSISIGLIILISGCDAMLHLTYSVENKSKTDITLFVPNYPVDRTMSIYGESKDTTIVLQPNEKVIVGFNSKIDFPWATRNIYRNSPGNCGIKIIENDTINELGCSKDIWKYRKRNSKLTIR